MKVLALIASGTVAMAGFFIHVCRISVCCHIHHDE